MTPGTPDIAELKRLRDALIQASVDADASPSGHRRSFLKACERSARRELEEAALNALPSLLASAEENARLRAAIEACQREAHDERGGMAWGKLFAVMRQRIDDIARAALGAPK